MRYIDIYTPGGGTQETLCLPLKYLPLWLAGIQSRRIRDERTQAKLILYQEECADVLANYFLGDGVNINPDEPVRSTLDIIEGMTKSQLLLIQKVRRINHLTEANTQDIARLDASKLDKFGIDPGLAGAVAVLTAAGTREALADTPTLTLKVSRGSKAVYDGRGWAPGNWGNKGGVAHGLGTTGNADLLLPQCQAR